MAALLGDSTHYQLKTYPALRTSTETKKSQRSLWGDHQFAAHNGTYRRPITASETVHNAGYALAEIGPRLVLGETECRILSAVGNIIECWRVRVMCVCGSHRWCICCAGLVTARVRAIGPLHVRSPWRPTENTQPRFAGKPDMHHHPDLRNGHKPSG